MSGAPRVSVTPDRIALRPGEIATVEVAVQNTGKVIEHFQTTIIGLPRDDLYQCEPAVVKLRPGESATLQVTLSVPERPAPDAGRYVLGVLVRSPYQPQLSRCEELRLDVRPAPALGVAVQPELATGGPEGSYLLRVTNDGNTPAAVSLHGTDLENRVEFCFRPRNLQLGPNSSAQATLTVRAPAPWSGQPVRRTLTVRANAAPDLSAERTVAFVQRPRIPGGPLRVVGIAAAVGILAAATLAGALVRNIQPDRQEPVAQANETQVTPEVPGGAGSSAAPGGASQSSPAASPGGSSSPTGSPTVAGNANAVPGVVDFTQLPDGQPAGNRFIPGDLYRAQGVILSSVVELAPQPCREATAVALRTKAGAGAFLTSSSATSIAACNTLPVRVAFVEPVRSTRLYYLGNGSTYSMKIELTDGTAQTVTSTSTNGVVTAMPYDAPDGMKIASVVFGHAGNDPNSKDPTLIKRVTFPAN